MQINCKIITHSPRYEHSLIRQITLIDCKFKFISIVIKIYIVFDLDK